MTDTILGNYHTCTRCGKITVEGAGYHICEYDTPSKIEKEILDDSKDLTTPDEITDIVFNTLSTRDKIDILFNNFGEFLKEKNKRYGDSALKPIQIFSKIDAGNQIYNRLDDKLSRIKNSNEIRKNDLADLLGYISLALIEKNWLEFDDLLD